MPCGLRWLSGPKTFADRAFRQGDSWSRTEAWLLTRPLACGPGWAEHVNQPQTQAEVEAVWRAIRRGSPLGSPNWGEATARRLGLESALRPRGRPKR